MLKEEEKKGQADQWKKMQNDMKLKKENGKLKERKIRRSRRM
jgi:hypothetical protein